MAQSPDKSSRRNFLLAVGAGGAATVAAIAVKQTPQTQQPVISGTGKRATRGYVASEHVNSYYRTTKV